MRHLMQLRGGRVLHAGAAVRLATRSSRRWLCTLDRSSWLQEVGYPGERFAASHTLPQYTVEFAGLASGAREIGVKTAITGRVTSVRESSNALCFYDLSADGATVQVLSTRKHFDGSDDDYAQTRMIKRGDVVGECLCPRRDTKAHLLTHSPSATQQALLVSLESPAKGN